MISSVNILLKCLATAKLLIVLKEYNFYIWEYLKTSQQNVTKILIKEDKISPCQANWMT